MYSTLSDPWNGHNDVNSIKNYKVAETENQEVEKTQK